MFIRFRQQGRRLQPSLMQTRRVDGKPRNEHIASLGSVDAEVSVRDRIAFWAKLPERLERLGNRVGQEDIAKLYAALHARIPMVTADEQRAVQEENAESDERFWDAMHGMNASLAEGHKAHIVLAERKIADVAPEVAKAAESRDIAKKRLEKIRRGESVPGGLGKPVDVRAAFRAAGWTTRDMDDAVLLHEVVEALGEEAIRQMVGFQLKAADKAHRRILRQMARFVERAD
jgi:hypothetical protein